MNKTKRVIRNEQKNAKNLNRQPIDSDKKIKIFAGVGILAFVLLVAIVCYETFHKDPVLQVGDQKYYESDMEILYNIYEQETTIEATNQLYVQYLGYGAEDYWNSDSVKTNGKSTAMSTAISNILLAKEAEKNGVSLTEEEKVEVEKNVDELLQDMSTKVLKRSGFTKEKLLPYLTSATLASKYYKQILEGYNVTAADVTVDATKYDEREVEAISVLLVAQDSSGNTAAIAEDKKAEYKAKMEEYLAKAKAGEDFSKLVPEGDETYSYGTKSFLVGEEEVDAKIEEAALQLKDGEYSDLIETESAFIIIKMKDTKSTNAYDEEVQKQIDAKKQELWKVDLDKLKGDYNVEILTKGWNQVELGTVTLRPGYELTKPTATPEATATPETQATPSAR